MHIGEVAVSLNNGIRELLFKTSQESAERNFLGGRAVVDRRKFFLRRIDPANPANVNGYRIELRAHAVARLFDVPCVDDGAVGFDYVMVARFRPTFAAFRFRASMVRDNISGFIALIAGGAMHYINQERQASH